VIPLTSRWDVSSTSVYSALKLTKEDKEEEAGTGTGSNKLLANRAQRAVVEKSTILQQ